MFVGRTRELTLLQRLFDGAVAGVGGSIVVRGEAGIGKTRLVGEFVAGVAAHATVASASAGGPWPRWSFEPWPTLLGQCRCPAVPGRPPVAALPPPPSAPPDPDRAVHVAARLAWFESVAAYLTRAATREPLLVVVDDLHEATLPALQLLLHLAVRLPGMRAVVVAILRDDVEVEERERQALLQELADTEHVLHLDGLAPEDIGSISRRVHEGPDHGPMIDAVHRATGGNPYIAGEVLRVLAAEGRLHGTPHRSA